MYRILKEMMQMCVCLCFLYIKKGLTFVENLHGWVVLFIIRFLFISSIKLQYLTFVVSGTGEEAFASNI